MCLLYGNGASGGPAPRRSSIPQPGFDRLKVYVPQSQRVRVKRTEEFDRVEAVKPCRVYAEHLVAQRKRTVMVFRSSMIGDVEHAECLEAERRIAQSGAV